MLTAYLMSPSCISSRRRRASVGQSERLPFTRPAGSTGPWQMDVGGSIHHARGSPIMKVVRNFVHVLAAMMIVR
jgi:hypothetical protein